MKARETNMSIEKIKNGVIVKLRGALNSESKEEYEKRVGEYFNFMNQLWIFDFTETDYISAVGLRSLFNMINKIYDRKGELFLVTNQPFIENIFESAGLTLVFPIYKSIQEVKKIKNLLY